MPETLNPILNAITNLGDSALLTALAFCCALYLAVSRNTRAAFVLTSALLLCLAAMGILKIYFIGCHNLRPSWQIESPSGHAAMSAAIYGTLAALVAKRFTGWMQWVPLFGAVLLIATIALSRVWFGYHTVNEVLLGLTVGCTIALGSVFLLQPITYVGFRVRYLALAGFVAIVLLYGTHAPAETLIRQLAALIKKALHFCS